MVVMVNEKEIEKILIKVYKKQENLRRFPEILIFLVVMDGLCK